MPKLSRDKGARWERKVAKAFADAFGVDCRRSSGQSRFGTDAPDVHAPVFWIECKVGKSFSIPRALHQAADDMYHSSLSKRWALAVTKKDNEKPLATMYLEDFLRLVAEWDACKDKASPVE